MSPFALSQPESRQIGDVIFLELVDINNESVFNFVLIHEAYHASVGAGMQFDFNGDDLITAFVDEVNFGFVFSRAFPAI